MSLPHGLLRKKGYIICDGMRPSSKLICCLSHVNVAHDNFESEPTFLHSGMYSLNLANKNQSTR